MLMTQDAKLMILVTWETEHQFSLRVVAQI